MDSCNVNYEKDIGIFTIESSFEVQGNTNIEEYIGKYTNYAGNVDFMIRGYQIQYITIVYKMIGYSIENAYEIVRTEVEYEDLDFYNETDFEVKVNYD